MSCRRVFTRPSSPASTKRWNIPSWSRGDYLFKLENRTLDAIRALGGNSPEDELRFAAAARVSEINKGLYRTFVGPMVRMATTEQSAGALRRPAPEPFALSDVRRRAIR